MKEILKIETRSHGNIDYLCWKGEIDISNSHEALNSALKFFDEKDSHAILDLTELSYLDSSGIKILFELAKKVQPRGRPFYLCIPAGSPLERLIEIAQIARVCKVMSSLDAVIIDIKDRQ